MTGVQTCALPICPRSVSGALEIALSADGGVWAVSYIFHGDDEKAEFSEDYHDAVCPVFRSRICCAASGQAVLR